MDPKPLTDAQRARLRALIDRGEPVAKARAEVLAMDDDDPAAMRALEPAPESCVGCGAIAYVHRWERRWTCTSCGRPHDRPDAC